MRPQRLFDGAGLYLEIAPAGGNGVYPEVTRRDPNPLSTRFHAASHGYLDNKGGGHKIISVNVWN